MPQVAHFWLVTTRWTILVLTLKGLELVDLADGGGVTHPLDGLPSGDHPHVLHGDDGVEKQLEALLMVGGGEPSWMIG